MCRCRRHCRERLGQSTCVLLMGSGILFHPLPRCPCFWSCDGESRNLFKKPHSLLTTATWLIIIDFIINRYKLWVISYCVQSIQPWTTWFSHSAIPSPSFDTSWLLIEKHLFPDSLPSYRDIHLYRNSCEKGPCEGQQIQFSPSWSFLLSQLMEATKPALHHYGTSYHTQSGVRDSL